MKSPLLSRLSAFLFAGVFFLNSAFLPQGTKTNLSDEGEAKLFIDGVEVQPVGTITLKKDATILLEATGLQPYSEVLLKVKKGGVKWAENTYIVNETGTVKQLLDIPERDLTVNCTVNYRNVSGEFKVAEFKLKIE